MSRPKQTPGELIPYSATPQDAVTAAVKLMESAGAYRPTDPIEDEIRNILTELNDEPLRVAVVGKTKAGKSTLINSLVGASVAPTDTLSCTKFVAWYRDAAYDWAQARLRTGRQAITIAWPPRQGAPIIGGVDDGDVDDIHVWRQALPRLAEWTVIDTPGYNESEPDVRERTRRVFAAESIDAVVFVLNGAAAAEELRFFAGVRADLAAVLTGKDEATHSSSSDFGLVNTLAVLTRIDMADDRDPFGGAEKVVAQHSNDLRGVATAVVPVLGLFAETANELTDDDFAHVVKLASLNEAQLLGGLFRSAATRLGLDEDSILRIETLFKPYGLRFAVDLVKTGQVTSRADLATAMIAHSRLHVLEQTLRERFTARAAALKARTAVRRLTHLSRDHDGLSAIRPYLTRILRLDAMHTLREYSAYERWQAGEMVLPKSIGQALTALAFRQDVVARAGLTAGATTDDIRTALRQRLGECDDFLSEAWPAAANDVVLVMRRSYSLMLRELTTGGVT